MNVVFPRNPYQLTTCVFILFLTVGVVIDTQPMDALAEISEDASFYCEASGSEPISYAWFRENRTQVESGGRISGSDSSTLTITSVVSSDYGEYFCNVSNVVNSQRSDGAVLTGLFCNNNV